MRISVRKASWKTWPEDVARRRGPEDVAGRRGLKTCFFPHAGQLGYRSSPTTNVNYLSYWAGQPSVDYTLLESQDQRDLGALDRSRCERFHPRLPRCLTGAGSGNNLGSSDYTPDVLKHAISNVMHSYRQERVKSSLISNQPSGEDSA